MAALQPVPSPTSKDWARFMAKVLIRAGGCWEWTGARFANGYGVFFLGGKLRRAHRVVYCWIFGDPGLGLDHICNRPACVNPDHLRPVTQRENVLKPDSQSRTAVNSRKVTCSRGHNDWATPNRTPGREHWRVCRTCVHERYLERHAAARKPGTWDRTKTCMYGHPWTPENTAYPQPGVRRCIVCKREWERRSRSR